MSRIVNAVLISGCLIASAHAADDAAAPMPAAPAAAMSPSVVHRIAPCEGGPHCVSTESQEEGRHVAPIRYSGSDVPAQEAMLRILGGIGSAKVVEVSPGYIHAEFHSTIMRFVDDVEMVFGNHQIKLRSSSRIGYYDFGVNRDRVEALRKSFNDIQP